MKLLGSIAALAMGAVYSETLQRPPRPKVTTEPKLNRKNKRKARRITRANQK